MGARFASHPDYANALMAAASEIFRYGTLAPAQRRITDITAVLKTNKREDSPVQ